MGQHKFNPTALLSKENKLPPVEPISDDVMVHGAMIYECEKCGKQWRMWLEVGVEGPGDYETGQRIMPCPFTIRCACGGMAQHVCWGSDIHLPSPRPLPNKATSSYFKLDREGLAAGKAHPHGLPVVKPDSLDLREYRVYQPPKP